jgi:hypothetical protein
VTTASGAFALLLGTVESRDSPWRMPLEIIPVY